MAKATTKQKAEEYLKRTGEKAVYASNDGFLFKLKQDAVAHARNLDKKEVSTYTLDAKPASKADDSKADEKTTTAGNQGSKTAK